MSREKLFHVASSRVKGRKKYTDSSSPKLWEEALLQVTKGWIRAPYKFADEGRLLVGGGELLVSPAYRFVAQRSDKLRVVGDPSREA